MKKTAVLVNIGRGAIIRESDLATALSEKIIYAAGLDVYEYEPFLGGVIELYNSDSRFVGEEMTYDGSTKIPEGTMLYTSLSVTNDEMMALVADQFSDEQKSMLAKHKLIIELRVDPQTGRVADVIFSFFNASVIPFTRIPVDVYRRVELALKENMIFTPTAESRRMNYFSFVWPQQF